MTSVPVNRPGLSLTPLSPEVLAGRVVPSSQPPANGSNGQATVGLTPFGQLQQNPSRPAGAPPGRNPRDVANTDSPKQGGARRDSRGGGNGAKAKMMELYRYWALLPETQAKLRALVDETLALKQVSTQAHTQKPRNRDAPVILSSDDEGKEEDGGAPCVVVEPVDGTDSLASSFPIGTPPRCNSAEKLASLALPQALSQDSIEHIDNSGEKPQPPSMPTSPYSKSLMPHSHGLRSPRERSPLPNVQHVVDELDLAHRRGALSPRPKDLSPSSPEQQTHRAISPMEFSLAPMPTDFHPTPVRTSSHRHMGESFGRRNSLRSESNASSRSNSPEPYGLAAQSSADPGDTVAFISSVQPPQQQSTPAFPLATLEDIPRFYFARGRTQTTGAITLEATRLIPNAPPILPPAVQQQQQLLLQQLAANGMTTSVFANGVLAPPQPISIPALTALPDPEVEQCVMKSFAQIKVSPSTSSVAGSAAVARRSLKSGVATNQARKSSSLNLSKTDAIYWQHVNSTMHRLTTQCFGLPGYFSRLITAAIAKKEAEPSTPPSPSLGGGGGGGGNPPAPRGITAQQVMDFYHTYLKAVPIVRRMFNVLVASSKANSSASKEKEAGKFAGASGSGSGMVAAEERNYLIREDFVLPLEVLMELHPGLAFLRQAVDFQAKYIETVILRIFYDIDVFDRGRISWKEFERSRLPEAMRQVDVMEDINSVLNYFSYEHFYVLYCRFWELDEDKDLFITPKDLERYAPPGSLNPVIIERVFRGCGRRLSSSQKGKMNYEDFVYFCLSEEDKANPRAIRYWFRILDTDGDGILSGFELESIYNYTKQRMISITTECIQFPDVMCQIRDMLPFEHLEGPALTDLLRYPQSSFVALNMIMNVAKFLQFEQRDPFVAHQDRLAGGLEKTEWDRFARAEYDRMAMEAEGDH